MLTDTISIKRKWCPFLNLMLLNINYFKYLVFRGSLKLQALKKGVIECSLLLTRHVSDVDRVLRFVQKFFG